MLPRGWRYGAWDRPVPGRRGFHSWLFRPLGRGGDGSCDRERPAHGAVEARSRFSPIAAAEVPICRSFCRARDHDPRWDDRWRSRERSKFEPDGPHTVPGPCWPWSSSSLVPRRRDRTSARFPVVSRSRIKPSPARDVLADQESSIASAWRGQSRTAFSTFSRSSGPGFSWRMSRLSCSSTRNTSGACCIQIALASQRS